MMVMAFGFSMVGLILWKMGRSAQKSAKSLESWYDDNVNLNFCVIPGHDERCFTYEYDLSTQEAQDNQFWAMVDFVNEQAWLKKSERQGEAA